MAGQPVPGFAGLLQQLRAEAGLTQEELADAAGLGQRTVSDLERGVHRSAHQDTARLLADALGLAERAKALFVAAARGRVPPEEVLAARDDAPTALAAMVVSEPGSSAVPVPRELPADVAAFTGRAVELAELDLLLPGAAQGVSAAAVGPVVISAVSGTAGVGKTALAVRWAHRAAEWFPDGQLYVNLRGYDPDQPVSPGEALAGFLRALGIPDQSIPLGEGERAARYRSLVAGKRLLVVLDNAATEEQVRPLLPGSSSVMVVVTSRDSLGGLVARDGARRLELDLLPQAEAVALVRALIGRRADTDVAATQTLAAQCARLPLALRVAAELAAARPRAPLTELTAELADEQDRLELLEVGGDPRGAVAGVFSWSYRHLPEDTAQMFRLLGLHPSQHWDAYAASALTNSSLPEARRLLGVLARAHLIQPAGASRYQMHDLLRAYAVSQATAHDTKTARHAALTRLFDYYLAASAPAADHLGPFRYTPRPDPPSVSTPIPLLGDRAAALAWLDAELATLVTVAAHTANHGWAAHATRLAATLHAYLNDAHNTEGLAMHGLALEAARRLGDHAAEAQALVGLGNSHWRHGRYQQCADLCEQALTVARQVGDQVTQANALIHLAISYEGLGRLLATTYDLYWQAIALYRALGDRAGEAFVLSQLAGSYFYAGQCQEATGHLEQALALGRETGDRYSMTASLWFLAEVDRVHGRYSQASDHLQEALALAPESGVRLSETLLTRLGLVCHRQGRYDLAFSYHRQALADCRELGNLADEAEALNNLGATLLATGHPEKAWDCHAAALALARQAGFALGEAESQLGLGEVSRWQGNNSEAYGYYQQALDKFRGTDVWSETEALNGTGEALLATGQYEKAHACLTEALTLAERTGYRHQQARAHRGLATACAATGHQDQARQHWRHALDIFTDLGVPEAAQMRASPADPEHAPAANP